jgi:Major royal jelly protein
MQSFKSKLFLPKRRSDVKSLTRASLAFCGILGMNAFALAQNNAQEQKPSASETHVKLVPVYEFDNGPAPSSVAVSDSGRIFVGFACSQDANQNSGNNLTQNGYHCGLAELKYSGGDTGSGQLQPYPNLEINHYDQDHPEDHFVDVRSIRVVGNHLWVLDGAAPDNGQVFPAAAKLICIDLSNDQIDRTIRIPERLVREGSSLKQLCLDMRAGSNGMAFISDSSPTGHNSIICVDLNNGHVWRRLRDTLSVQADGQYVLTSEGQAMTWSGSPQAQPAGAVQAPANQAAPAQGQPNQPVQIGVEALAVSNDGSTLFYAPLCSSHLYSIDTGVLCKHYDQSGEAINNGATNNQVVENGAVVQSSNDQAANNLANSNNNLANANNNMATNGATANQANDQSANANVTAGVYVNDDDREAARNEVNSAVRDCGDKDFPTSSMAFDDLGNLYLADVQNGIIRERESDGTYTAVIQGPPIAWPGSLCIATDNQVHENFMYFISMQYDRKPMFHNGMDQRKPPYYLFRFLVSNGASAVAQ